MVYARFVAHGSARRAVVDEVQDVAKISGCQIVDLQHCVAHDLAAGVSAADRQGGRRRHSAEAMDTTRSIAHGMSDLRLSLAGPENRERLGDPMAHEHVDDARRSSQVHEVAKAIVHQRVDTQLPMGQSAAGDPMASAIEESRAIPSMWHVLRRPSLRTWLAPRPLVRTQMART